ncbi:hypothetical protein K4F52_006541 [Lecanicillium sp. MT-2017a]|nr:hypothetical protein K4F52_006541 [Lecanicillium sp. MT-2017a]
MAPLGSILVSCYDPMDGTVDLQPLLFKLTFDTTMFLLFGESVASEDWGQVAGQESEFAKAFNLSQEYLSYRGRLGEGVGYCVYAMHRRKDIYGDDAEEFRPERWEGDSLKNVGWAYLPFNGGPRLCLGPEEFGLLEVAYTVARLVQIFPTITVSPTEAAVKVGQEKQTLTLVVASAEGCVVSLKSTR